MEKDTQWHTDMTKIQHDHYVRNSRAITAAWFVFCACYTILNAVAFIQPFWIGDTNESPGVGYFGLYEWCERSLGSEYTCSGDFLDFTSIQNDYFRAASFLVGGAALLFIFSIICMLLFLFLKAATVLRICGWLQIIAALFMAVACVIYPVAWDDPVVQRICGGEATVYNMDKCQIRWGYILAIVLIFDAAILAILAFVLAARQAKLTPEFKKLREDDNHSFTNHRYIDTFEHDKPLAAQPPPQPHQELTHQRPAFSPLQSSFNQSYSMNEPLVIPVDDFEEPNLSKSDPSSARSGPDSVPPPSSSEPEVTPRSVGSNADSNARVSARSAASTASGSLPGLDMSQFADDVERKGDSSDSDESVNVSLENDDIPL